MAPYLKLDGGHAVQPRKRALFLGAVFGAADVAHANRRSVHGGDDEIIESFRVGDPSHGAQHLLARAARHIAAGDISILPLDGVSHRSDGNLVSGQSVRVYPNVDGAFQAADEANLSHADGTLELHLDDLVGDLRQLAQRPVAGNS